MNHHPEDKTCYCHTCEKAFHYLGIATHRWAHKTRKEDCEIEYTNLNVVSYKFSKDK